jgi:hypothetical protein
LSELITSGNRLVITYYSDARYTFGNLKFGASDEDAYEVVKTITSLQDDAPQKVMRVVTKQLM